MNDKIYETRIDYFSKDFMSMIAIKLENNGLEVSTTNILRVWQELDLNDYNLEKNLFDRYKLSFIDYLEKNIKIID